jgi:mono/diheme cytochrome c family protein
VRKKRTEAREQRPVPNRKTAFRPFGTGLWPLAPGPLSRLSAVLLAMVAASACHGPDEVYVLPDDIVDFSKLYSENCAGCHGPDGHHGAARPLNNAAYQAVVTRDALIQIISEGRRGTAMPAFAKTGGGSLTVRQIEILADEMQKQWAKPNEMTGVTPPPFEAAQPGDATRGEAAFQTYCASCHGKDGAGMAGKAGSIVDPLYLKLITDQGLRSAVIAGRPEDGAPDWRNDVPGHPMQPQEISDVVAWIASHRERKQP